MRRPSPQKLCQIYASLVLLAAASLSSVLYLAASLVLALVMIFITIRPQPPRLNIVVFLLMVFLTPLMLASPLDHITGLPPLATQIIAIVLTIPVLYLMDYNLRENARQADIFQKRKGERYTTPIFAPLVVVTLAIILIAPIVKQAVLLFSGITFLIYLLSVLAWILVNIPRRPFTTETITKRIIAGTTGEVSLKLTSKAPVQMRAHLSPAFTWVQVAPSRAVLNKGTNSLRLSFTPPLAGQSRPGLLVSAIDPRGFIQINQWLEPVDLHIIPAAKYAEWLATKYLEQAGMGTIPEAAVRFKTIKKRKQGIEYQESRNYQPGDPLRDIDWKHTLKLRQLIVREYQDAGEQAAIIAVNLAVADEEGMDKLAFNLITIALTLARENIPTALAAYNHEKVILSTGTIQSLEMLRLALSLVKDITIVKLADRLLEPTDIAKIRRNIKQLQETESEPARRLLDLFNFEHHSIEEFARSNPATLALAATSKKVPPPAMILLVSQLNHDAEAVLVITEKLSKRHFSCMPVETA
jgi:hypothetical protein